MHAWQERKIAIADRETTKKMDKMFKGRMYLLHKYDSGMETYRDICGIRLPAKRRGYEKTTHIIYNYMDNKNNQNNNYLSCCLTVHK